MEAAKGSSSFREIAALVKSGRHADALQVIDAALQNDPGNAELSFARGSLLFEWGRHWEARPYLLRARERTPPDAALDLQLAWIDLRSGRLDSAEQLARDAVARDHANWQAHFALGAVLRARGHADAAERCYQEALSCSPGNLDCLLDLAATAIGARRFDLGEAYARRAVSEHPDAGTARAALGAALIWQDRFGEANEAFGLVSSTVDFEHAPPDAGIPLRDGGRVEEAIEFYRRVLPRNPGLNAHMHYAYSLLKAGHLREGFEQNEFRWMIEPLRSIRPRPVIPPWEGHDITGKTVLLTTEQGVGDVIQFMRYAELVKALGATVHVALRKPMREIVEGMAGVDAVHQPGEPLPDVDFAVPVMSLPRIFGTTLDSIPARVPYVPLKQDRVDRWRRELQADDKLRVGIVWSGDPIGQRNPYKSIPIRFLAELAGVGGVRFYSLQKGDAARDAAAVRDRMDLVDLSPAIRDFGDTAAIIDSLDLVVTICTSVAHLAGALGKPTWTLLSEPADWRWMERRSDTPWYPTMRLFRQPRQGDWAGVVEAVGVELRELARHRDRAIGAPKTVEPSIADVQSTSADSSPSPSICRAIATRHGMLQIRPDDTRTVRSLAWYGDYLGPQLQVLVKGIAAGSIVVDVASAPGFDVPLLASAIGATGHLFLCESRPALLPVLANNLNANGVANTTTIAAPLRGGARRSAQDRGSVPHAMPLDRLGLPAFHWLKINEDADALEVMEGATDCIWRHRPRLFVSAIDAREMQQIEERVRDFGYHAQRLDAPLFDPCNFNRRAVDIFGGQTAHLLLAVPEESGDDLPAWPLDSIVSDQAS